MSSRICSVVVVALLVGVAAVSAQAQPMRMSAEQRTQMLKDSLQLTKDQSAKVLEIYQLMDKERAKLMESGPSDRQARWESMRSLMDTTDTRIESLLTAEQKAKYQFLKQQRMQRRGRFQRN